MRFVFPSLARPSIRYAIYSNSTDNPGYNWRQTGGIVSDGLSCFDTLGDGEVQHTSEYCPLISDGIDIFESLVMVLDRFPTTEHNEFLQRLWRHNVPGDSAIRFAESVRYKENKRQFYTWQGDFKVSSAESKMHDKRWHRVEPEHDGSLSAVVSLLFSDSPYKPLYWIERLGSLLRICTVLDVGTWNLAGELRKYDQLRDISNEDVRRLRDSFELIDAFYKAVDSLRWVLGVRNRRLEESKKAAPCEA